MTKHLACSAEKLEACQEQLQHSGRISRFIGPPDKKVPGGEQQLLKVCRDAGKMSLEQVKGISCQVAPPPACMLSMMDALNL